MKGLKFEPLLKSILWGGDKIISFKNLDMQMPTVGESWEISGVEGNVSIVAEGPYKGRTLTSLVEELKGQLVGEENYQRFGNEFPLLIKFIDAKQPLSIQVHPTDEIAQKQGKGKYGKTEMWYVMESDADAKLRSGMKSQLTPDEYAAKVEDGTITDALCEYNVKNGDVFFLPAGRIHSIGAGCFIAEIQQTSDVTYRIYDFKRKDKDGNERELHTELAKDAIDFTVYPEYRTQYTPAKNIPVDLVSCDYFTTSVYDLTEPMAADYSELDSFVIYITLEGSATLINEEGEELTIKAGESVLIPACTKEITIKPNEHVKFLETFV
ncbi:MAG: class I mannose-6-phosphate isomerase [Bacteroidales bacterium]|nr:class I mannose-6-phosphate isomerase [Candidatus Minthousia equi]